MLKTVTNIVNASQITGVLPVLNGGTGVTTKTGTGNVVLSASPTLSGDVSLSTGNLIVSNGKGIDFSAAPGTGTSELLNDYEEGTWTPVITASTSNPIIGYQTQSGRYTKVGRLVTCQLYVQFNTVLGGSGDVKISLPFTPASINQGSAAALTYNVTFPQTTLYAMPDQGAATLTMLGTGSNAVWSAHTVSDLKVSAVQAYSITLQFIV
jgi:autotransporter-associated beta strand protein